jgi:hypothetical protein
MLLGLRPVTERRVAANALLTAIPELLRLEAEAAAALADPSPASVSSLVAWRQAAGHVAAQADRALGLQAEALVSEINAATALVGRAERALGTSRQTTALNNALGAMATVTSLAAPTRVAAQSYNGELE